MEKKHKILVVDDEPGQLSSLRSILEIEGYLVETAESAPEALGIFKTDHFDLVLTDLILGSMSGVDLLDRVKHLDRDIEVIVITGFGSIKNAVETMKKGAFSYFIKGNPVEELLLEIQKALNLAKLRSDNDSLRQKPLQDKYLLKTKSRAFSHVLDLARRAAESNASVFLTGESGVGKEIIAGFIHELSERKNSLFYPVNCHALSDSLLEEELFGHEKGSFTGADCMRKGKFEAVNGGTLLLDEIGDISQKLQAKLLRVIETRQVQRIGGHRNIPVDFRLISATNSNIEKEIREKRFRQDLYYRLCVIHIELPPLRKRREDIRILAEFFLEKYMREMKRDLRITDQVIWSFLEQHDYPGNIRELKNMMERLAVLSEGGVIDQNTLKKADFFPQPAPRADGQQDLDDSVTNLRDFRKKAEKDHISRILKLAGNNKEKAAGLLGISVRQLFNKINEFSL